MCKTEILPKSRKRSRSLDFVCWQDSRRWQAFRNRGGALRSGASSSRRPWPVNSTTSSSTWWVQSSTSSAIQRAQKVCVEKKMALVYLCCFLRMKYRTQFWFTKQNEKNTNNTEFIKTIKSRKYVVKPIKKRRNSSLVPLRGVPLLGKRPFTKNLSCEHKNASSKTVGYEIKTGLEIKCKSRVTCC